MTTNSLLKNPTLIAAIIAIVIGLGIFGIMWHSVMTVGDFTRFDQPILDFTYQLRSPLLTGIMEFITNLLAPFTFAAIIGVICIIWARQKKETWRPLLLIGSLACSALLSVIIKQVVERSRPPYDFMVEPFELSYSFPSGHTLGIAVFVFVLGYLLYSRRFEKRHAALWATSGLFLIALIAFSRLYLGYHWLTDVTASVGLGLVVLGVVMIIDTLTPDKLKR
jgi:undecaprenyl-diphosphatase